MTVEAVPLAVAFGAGVISFLSPCVLPIVPAYLSLVTGLDVSELQAGGRLRVARAVFNSRIVLTRLPGLLVLAMALFLAGSLVVRAPWLLREHRFHGDTSRFGPLAAPVAGMAFGFGWTPCIGPVLTSILALAATRDGALGAECWWPPTPFGSACPSSLWDSHPAAWPPDDRWVVDTGRRTGVATATHPAAPVSTARANVATAGSTQSAAHIWTGGEHDQLA